MALSNSYRFLTELRESMSDIIIYKQKLSKVNDFHIQSTCLLLIARKALKLLWLIDGCSGEIWFYEGGYILRDEIRKFLKNKPCSIFLQPTMVFKL